MTKRLTKAQLEARAFALDEAASQLTLSWTDDPVEAEEGLVVSMQLQRMAQRMLDRAAREPNHPTA